MVDSLDVVAVRIEEEGGVIPGVVRPFPWGSVVDSPMSKANLMERIHGRAILRLESEMVPPGQRSLRGDAIRAGNEQLIGPEISVGSSSNGNVEYPEDRFIEPTVGSRSRTTNWMWSIRRPR